MSGGRSVDREATVIAADFLANKAKKDVLEAESDKLREELVSVLAANTVTQPTVWEVGQARVTWVRGREKQSLDRGKLVRLGVTSDILDKATVKSVGRPSIRIESKIASGEESSQQVANDGK